MNQFFIKPRNTKQKNVCLIFTVYWIVLLVWQNLFNTQLRGSADALLKMCLLAFLTFSFLTSNSTIKRDNFALCWIFAMTQLITLILCDSDNVSLGILVSYIYPTLMLFLVFCVGSDFIVTKRQIDKMNNVILVVLVISILYTLVFEPDQYITALTAEDSGYGNELNSFFTSMYEYAMYLFYGITICIDRLAKKNKHKWIYIISLIAFSATMIFTFSRTAILGCVVYLIVYSFLNLRSSIGWKILLFFVIVAAVILSVPQLREYAFEVVWKSGNSSSRESLYAKAIDLFKESGIVEQLIGRGIAGSRLFFQTQIGYGSIHNGFLQVLMYYGLIGLAFLIGFFIYQIVIISNFFKIDREVALFSLGMLAFVMVSMMPTTLIIFNSSIDCYFMTVIMIVIPNYQRNAIKQGKYLDEVKQ